MDTLPLFVSNRTARMTTPFLSALALEEAPRIVIPELSPEARIVNPFGATVETFVGAITIPPSEAELPSITTPSPLAPVAWIRDG